MDICEKHDNIDQSLKTLMSDVSEIKTALIGDIDGKTGLCQKVIDLDRRLKEVETFITDVKKQISSIVYKLAGVAIGSAGSGIALTKIIEALTK